MGMIRPSLKKLDEFVLKYRLDVIVPAITTTYLFIVWVQEVYRQWWIGP